MHSSTQPQEHLIVGTEEGRLCKHQTRAILAQYLPTTHTHNFGRVSLLPDLSPRDRQTILGLPVPIGSRHLTRPRRTLPQHPATCYKKTSGLQACLLSLRTSPRPLHDDRRIYRVREYNTGSHSEGGKVVPPGITTSDRGGSSQTRNVPVVLTHQQRRQRRGASLEVTLSVLMSRHPNKC